MSRLKIMFNVLQPLPKLAPISCKTVCQKNAGGQLYDLYGNVYVRKSHYTAKSYVGGRTSSRWRGAKIPTLARPTQEGCKAGAEPAGRDPPHQHVEDGIY
ncbi:hypothetical protein AVEN_206252-1 [Araneus ventricosus]|uniref:Uncharacterized protein n=1 Tax=Araneus ventricosus TaxID=182803 RepID=A0A4Y2S7B7_ARAVE|nr:hypothetical protein AVEN_206252-1 [Araneus ventricosus]